MIRAHEAWQQAQETAAEEQRPVTAKGTQRAAEVLKPVPAPARYGLLVKWQ